MVLGVQDPNNFYPVWHNLFYSFTTEISNSYNKQQASAQLINPGASRNELKTKNKHKLLFNNFSDKLLFQQVEALPNRVFLQDPRRQTSAAHA
jgi:hypothetical protein